MENINKLLSFILITAHLERGGRKWMPKNIEKQFRDKKMME